MACIDRGPTFECVILHWPVAGWIGCPTFDSIVLKVLHWRILCLRSYIGLYCVGCLTLACIVLEVLHNLYCVGGPTLACIVLAYNLLVVLHWPVLY